MAQDEAAPEPGAMKRQKTRVIQTRRQMRIKMEPMSMRREWSESLTLFSLFIAPDLSSDVLFRQLSI